MGCDLLTIYVLSNIVNTTLRLKALLVLGFKGFNTTKKMFKKVFIKAPFGAFFILANNWCIKKGHS